MNFFASLFFSIVLFTNLPAWSLPSPAQCSEVYPYQAFKNHLSFLDADRLIDGGLDSLRGALYNLENGQYTAYDLLMVLKMGDPIRLSATQAWNQGRTEKLLWELVEALKDPENRARATIGDLGSTVFFRERVAPWFRLVPSRLLKELVLASSGGSIAKAHPDWVKDLTPRLAELTEALGADSPTVHEIIKRAIDNPRVLNIAYKLESFPPVIQTLLRKTWLVDPLQWGVTIAGFRRMNFQEKNQLIDIDQLQNCGTCPFMARGHFEPFHPPSRGEGTSLITYQGVLIGLIKTTGDPSFLALRNVTNERGERVLFAGGVYLPPIWMLGYLRFSKDGRDLFPLQYLEITEADPLGQSPFSFYPLTFTKSPVEIQQLQGVISRAHLNSSSIRRGYELPMGGKEEISGEPFKQAIRILRHRAQERKGLTP